MSDLELRVPEPEQNADLLRTVVATFGNQASAEMIADELLIWEPDRALGVSEAGRWVAGAGVYSFEVTVPGGAYVPAAGVTWVGVSPTHRRRGLLRRLMARQLDDIAERGEPLALLTASESSIYGRFGYGPAAWVTHYAIEPTRSAFAQPLDDPGGCRLVDKAEAAKPLAAAYERCRPARAGSVTRSAGFWAGLLHDLPEERQGSSGLFCVVHDDASGEPDGFALYRVRHKWSPTTGGLPASTAVVLDLHGATAGAEAALWRFCCDIDLIARVEVEARPVDDMVRWRLAEPRRLQTMATCDWLWARVLDVPAALSARAYRTSGRLVLEVVDELRPQSGGRFRLDAGPDGASCGPAPEASPDLSLGTSELASLYLGGVAPEALHAVGRIDEHTPGAIETASLLFPTGVAPWCGTMF